jgi:hypothetical protein
MTAPSRTVTTAQKVVGVAVGVGVAEEVAVGSRVAVGLGVGVDVRVGAAVGVLGLGVWDGARVVGVLGMGAGGAAVIFQTSPARRGRITAGTKARIQPEVDLGVKPRIRSVSRDSRTARVRWAKATSKAPGHRFGMPPRSP